MKDLYRKIEFSMYCVNKLNINRSSLQQSIVMSIYNSSLFITEQTTSVRQYFVFRFKVAREVCAGCGGDRVKGNLIATTGVWFGETRIPRNCFYYCQLWQFPAGECTGIRIMCYSWSITVRHETAMQTKQHLHLV